MIVGIVGYSDSGKTTLVTALIQRLSREGISAATVKHVHAPSSLMPPGKDTTRHLEAGAQVSMGISPDESVIYLGGGRGFEEAIELIVRLVAPDVIIVEGFKDAPIPKVILGEAEAREPILMRGACADEVLDDLTHTIRREVEVERTMRALPGLDCRKCGHSSCRALAEAVVEGEAGVDDCRNLPDSGVTVLVDGQRVSIGDFVSRIIGNTINSMICSLKGVDDPGRIEIVIERGG